MRNAALRYVTLRYTTLLRFAPLLRYCFASWLLITIPSRKELFFCSFSCVCPKKQLPLHIFSARVRISQSQIKNWDNIVKAQGYEGLRMVGQHGRPPKKYDMGRPKKQESQTELEILQRELKYLRAENAYLKKLRALVLEKEAQRRKNEL